MTDTTTKTATDTDTGTSPVPEVAQQLHEPGTECGSEPRRESGIESTPESMAMPLREHLAIPCADPGFTDELARWAAVIAARVTGSPTVSDSALANAAIAVAWAAAAGVSVLSTTTAAPGSTSGVSAGQGVRTVVAGLMVPRVSDRMLDRAKAGLVRAVVDAELAAAAAAAVLDRTAPVVGLVMVRAIDAPDRKPRRSRHPGGMKRDSGDWDSGVREGGVR